MIGELLLTLFIVVLLWGGRFPRVSLCTVTGFTFWASFDTGSRAVLAPGGIDTTTFLALGVLVLLGGIFPSMDVFAVLEEYFTLEAADVAPKYALITPKYALITLLFLVVGLATGAGAASAWGI
jgi:hypothetical protein